MKMLIFLFKSGLPVEEILRTSEIWTEAYRKVKGLLQKFYVSDPSTDHVEGVFVFDSKQTLKTFRDLDLTKSTGEAYRFLEPPSIRCA
jgi:hypothetical protein